MEFDHTSVPEINSKQVTLNLASLLDAHAVPYRTWTEQKTIDDLAAEIQAGESVLSVSDDDKLYRHTAVAWIDVFSTNNQGEKVYLRESRQVFNDGRPLRTRTNLLASLGEKMFVGSEDPEIPSEAARRGIAEELGIMQVDNIKCRGTAKRELEASSYPGLATIYTDHFFTVEVPFIPEGYKEVQAQKTTYFEWELAPMLTEERLEKALNCVHSLLPDLASDLIVEYQDLSDPTNVAFAAHPDEPLHHSPSWHQYGILTHSEKFRERLAHTVPGLLEQWGISETAEPTLQEVIDGVSRRSLLQMAAELHDIGKFTARQVTQAEDGGVRTNFTNHEAHSGAIVRLGLKEILTDLGCTEAQIEYIARCAELHFELGKVRRTAINCGEGFTFAFAHSGLGKQAMRDIISEYPDYALEIGLMFIADSFSKTDVYAVAHNDIDAQKESLERQLSDKGLNPRLIKQSLQMPVNIEVAKQYLILWASTQEAEHHV